MAFFRLGNRDNGTLNRRCSMRSYRKIPRWIKGGCSLFPEWRQTDRLQWRILREEVVARYALPFLLRPQLRKQARKNTQRKGFLQGSKPAGDPFELPWSERFFLIIITMHQAKAERLGCARVTHKKSPCRSGLPGRFGIPVWNLRVRRIFQTFQIRSAKKSRTHGRHAQADTHQPGDR